MIEVQRDLDRHLTLLRNFIQQRGFTQLEVQQALGWGKSYISQLLTKQKGLRVEQLLLILNVIGVDPQTFFTELYWPQGIPTPSPQSAPTPPAATARREELSRVQATLTGLVDLLLEKGLVTARELRAAEKAARDDAEVQSP